MKKVLIIAYKNLTFNTRIVRFCKSFSELGFEVTVISLKKPKIKQKIKNVKFFEIYEETPQIYTITSIVNSLYKKFVYKNETKIKLFLSDYILKIFFFFGLSVIKNFSKNIFKVIKKKKFDLIIGHDTYSLIPCSKIKKKNSMLIYDAVEFPHKGRNTSNFIYKNHFVLKKLRDFEIQKEKKIIKKSDHIITVSHGLKNFIKKEFHKKPFVLRNFRNLEKKTSINLKSKLNLNKKDFLILYSSSLDRDEGIDKFIKILPKLPSYFKVCMLSSTVDQVYKEYLFSLIKKLGINNKCFFLNNVPSYQFINFISKSDIAIITKRGVTLNQRYGLPNSVFDMISAEIPIVYNNKLPDIDQLIKENHIGVSFDINKPMSIIRSIKYLKKNIKIFKKNIKEFSLNNSWDSEFKRIQHIIIKKRV